MARPLPEPKRQALRQRSALNPRAHRVTDPLFQRGDFFDPHDVVQVKYEMLRRVDAEQAPVTRTAAVFGVSRPTFYQARSAFTRAGLPGLVPEKPGPRRAHKLTPAVLDFVAQERADNPAITATVLATRIRRQFAVTVHPRSIARAGMGHQKKR